jgi:hypothetical protein
VVAVVGAALVGKDVVVVPTAAVLLFEELEPQDERSTAAAPMATTKPQPGFDLMVAPSPAG